jgi:hypothetical protein
VRDAAGADPDVERVPADPEELGGLIDGQERLERDLWIWCAQGELPSSGLSPRARSLHGAGAPLLLNQQAEGGSSLIGPTGTVTRPQPSTVSLAARASVSGVPMPPPTLTDTALQLGPGMATYPDGD